ncbi:uncharacterized protein LOC107014249 [Solanum pennellii]|uniref:Uncharacterized protein LOC107014249 n=1 Tax=Solanum pennellii TaxID=28526 RepID=A0ABM1GDI5_SOLPN|nr:uncharacterized protein LOC107014249 [Solanum pennellii]
MTESAMNSSSYDHENSSMLQEDQVKKHREPMTAAYSCKNKKKNIVSLIEDDGGDAPIVDLVPTEEYKRDMIGKDNNNFSIVDVVSTEETEMNMELAVGCEFCVTGYHKEIPLDVLMGEVETTHNYINESLADKLGCETVPIQPQIVRSDLGEMVTSRLCNNFQLSMEGIVFNLKVYLLPLPLKYDMILGGEWLGALEKIVISYAGIELYLLEGEKKFIPFKKPLEGEDASVSK